MIVKRLTARGDDKFGAFQNVYDLVFQVYYIITSFVRLKRDVQPSR